MHLLFERINKNGEAFHLGKQAAEHTAHQDHGNHAEHTVHTAAAEQAVQTGITGGSGEAVEDISHYAQERLPLEQHRPDSARGDTGAECDKRRNAENGEHQHQNNREQRPDIDMEAGLKAVGKSVDRSIIYVAGGAQAEERVDNNADKS